MTSETKLGLALSGGGFRSTAFHLGVLKRLYELGILDKVDVFSTVSGGSIAGAFYVYWRAIGSKSVTEPEVWPEFERRLVAVMKKNVRGYLLLCTAVAPGVAAFILTIAGLALAGFAPGKTSTLLFAGIGAIVCAYLSWHILSSRFLLGFYNRALFQGKHLQALALARQSKNQKLPELFINATALETGELVLFTEKERVGDVLLAGSRSVPVVNIFTGLIEHFKSMHRQQAKPGETTQTIWRSDFFSRAVAASSAVPGIFPPYSVGSAFQSFMGSMARRFPDKFHKASQKRSKDDRRYLAVDGGIFDNQGIQALLERKCSQIIVSDAASTMVPVGRMSMIGQLSQLKRSQNIIFSRLRNLGYNQLELRKALQELIEELKSKGASPQKLAALNKKLGPFIEAHCSVELRKRVQGEKGLSKSLTRLVSAIRTDLDRFSSTEISALMFHGYTSVDQALKDDMKGLKRRRVSLKFESVVPELNDIKWNELSSGERYRYENHLLASGIRLAAWRWCKRRYGLLNIWIAEQPWIADTAIRIRDRWRAISPGWKKEETFTVSVKPEHGEEKTEVYYGWRRTHWLRNLGRKIQKGWARTERKAAKRDIEEGEGKGQKGSEKNPRSH